jgi:hypothetical protein
MDVARHVIDTFFKDTPNPLVRHHLDSYYDFVTTKIPRYINASNPKRLYSTSIKKSDLVYSKINQNNN